MTPKRRNVFLAFTMVVLRGVAYSVSFLAAFVGTVGSGKSHSHHFIIEPTIGISTAHADAPVLSGGSSDSGGGVSGGGSDSGCSGSGSCGSAGGCGSE